MWLCPFRSLQWSIPDPSSWITGARNYLQQCNWSASEASGDRDQFSLQPNHLLWTFLRRYSFCSDHKRYGLGIFCCYSSSCVFQKQTLEKKEHTINRLEPERYSICHLFLAKLLRVDYLVWLGFSRLNMRTVTHRSIKNNQSFTQFYEKIQFGTNPTSATI